MLVFIYTAGILILVGLAFGMGELHTTNQLRDKLEEYFKDNDEMLNVLKTMFDDL